MKKGWKIFWIACGVTALAGVVLTVTGLMTGAAAIGMESARIFGGWIRDGGLEELREKGMEALDEVGDALDEPESSAEEYMPAELNGTTVQSFDNVASLKVDVPNVAVSIRSYSGEKLLVDTDSLAEEIRKDIQISGDGEEVEVEIDHDWYRDPDGGNVIYISVPENTVLPVLEAETSGGWLEVTGLNVEDMKISVGAGRADIREFEAEIMEADCGAGQLVIEGSARQMTEISCDTGEVIFTAPGGEEDYDYEVSCGIGEITLGTEDYSGINNRVRIENGTGRLIRAECGIGRIGITFDPGTAQ